jgi:hypothetical protein
MLLWRKNLKYDVHAAAVIFVYFSVQMACIVNYFVFHFTKRNCSAARLSVIQVIRITY